MNNKEHLQFKREMKTPIQQLIEDLELKKADAPPFYAIALLTAISFAESMLEKEKSAIQQAFYEGMLCQGFDPNMGRAEMYYNETFKTKEK